MGTRSGWSLLLEGDNPFQGGGRFPLPAYSEFMPAPWIGRKPYGTDDDRFVPPPDEHGFPVSEYEQLHQIVPGLQRIAAHLAETVRRQLAGQHAFSKALLDDNPYLPPELLAHAASLPRRRVMVLPLALSRTQDDKGRVRYALFGASDAGPARPFWMGLYRAPDEELPEPEGLALLRPLLERGAGLTATDGDDLFRAGFRVLPAGRDPDFPDWGDEPIPRWARRFVVDDAVDVAGLRALLTFRPFASLPQPVRGAFLDGALELLPFPASLVFFGHRGYRRLARELPQAIQIPLLHLFPRDQAASDGLRIPQSGWLDEPTQRAAPARAVSHGPVVAEVTRTHRWNRTHRDEDEATLLEARDRVTLALFSNDPDRLGLYDKPMARNVQLWTEDHHLLLDGPRHGRSRIEAAARVVGAGGHFGYRFYFPPMRVRRHELVWHLPLCAVLAEGGAEVIDGPRGYFGARSWERAAAAPPLDLWPRLLRREPHLDAAELFEHEPGRRRRQTAYNVRKVLETSALLGKPLGPTQADRLLTGCKERNFQEWLVELEGLAADRERGRRLCERLRRS